MCFSTEQLDIYVEKTADEKLAKEIEEHLPTCKACNDEVRERLAFKKFLTQKFVMPDTPHPDFEDVEAFYYDRLSKEKNKVVLDHLFFCEDCKESLDVVRTGRMIEEGKIAVPVEFPAKLSPKLEAYFMKSRIKKIILKVVQKRFPDMQEFFRTVWEKLSGLPELAFLLPKKLDLAGALGFSDLKAETPESDILKMIITMEDVLPKISEKEDVKEVVKRIRGSAKKNKLKSDLVEDLVEITQKLF